MLQKLFHNITNAYEFYWKSGCKMLQVLLQVMCFLGFLMISIFLKMLQTHNLVVVLIVLYFVDILGGFCCNAICRKLIVVFIVANTWFFVIIDCDLC
jgi:hypothetical protein